MSRSRRKTPVTGLTTARSEKDDKRIINRGMRRLTKQKLRNMDDAEAIILPENPNEIMNVWSMNKDGRQRYDKANKPQCEKCTEHLRCTIDDEYKSRCDGMRNYERYRKAMRK